MLDAVIDIDGSQENANWIHLKKKERSRGVERRKIREKERDVVLKHLRREKERRKNA